MPLSEFQKAKVQNVYTNMYDTNKDGVIDEADFNEAIAKISELHHWGKNDKAYSEAQATLKEIWVGLRKAADKNQDGKVTQEEWREMWTKTLDDVENGQDFPDWQRKYMEFMFDANDTSGDDWIDRGEYVAIQKEFGNSQADSEKAFDTLVKDMVDKKISKKDFENLWKEYFTSNDRKERGNFLFGLPPGEGEKD